MKHLVGPTSLAEYEQVVGITFHPVTVLYLRFMKDETQDQVNSDSSLSVRTIDAVFISWQMSSRYKLKNVTTSPDKPF